MTSEASTFVISEIEWLMIPEKTLRPGRRPPQEVPCKPRRALISCGQCGHRWRSSVGEDDGQMALAIGRVLITCPLCNAYGVVPMAELRVGSPAAGASE